MKKIPIDLSIVIPAYNEEGQIGRSLDKLSRYIYENNIFTKLNIQVVVVCADSTDNTHLEVIRHSKQFNNFKFIKTGKKIGKGRDVNKGVLNSDGKCIIFMDADLATPLLNIELFYNQIISGEDIVIGVRNLKIMHSSYSRRFISQCGNLLFRFASGLDISDTQCGFKAFSYNSSRICFKKQSIMGWGFDMELLTIAYLKKLHVKSMPIENWKNGNKTTIGNPFYSALLTLIDLLIIVKNRVQNKY